MPEVVTYSSANGKSINWIWEDKEDQGEPSIAGHQRLLRLEEVVGEAVAQAAVTPVLDMLAPVPP